MTHIEFLGPPGAGKSTIFSQLIDSNCFYGGTANGAVQRIFLEKAGLKYWLPYRVTPTAIRNFFDNEIIEYRFGHMALEDFLRNYPRFINLLSRSMNAVTYEPEKIFSLCKRSAEQYQLGVSTVADDEVLCLDESFAQRAFAILWREPDDSFSLEEYFESVPSNKLVVHVDAPVDICLERQKQRGNVVVAQDWETDDLEVVQNRARQYCSQIRDYLLKETEVITIKNTNSVEEAVEEIETTFSNIKRERNE